MNIRTLSSPQKRKYECRHWHSNYTHVCDVICTEVSELQTSELTQVHNCSTKATNWVALIHGIVRNIKIFKLNLKLLAVWTELLRNIKRTNVQPFNINIIAVNRWVNCKLLIIKLQYIWASIAVYLYIIVKITAVLSFSVTILCKGNYRWDLGLFHFHMSNTLLLH